MKAVICAVNSKYVHSSLAPWYLKAAADNNAEVVEVTINTSTEETVKRLTEKQCDVICFSTYIWNKTYIKGIIPLVKEIKPNVKLLIGGPEVSYNQQQVFDEIPLLDFIIAGEGEEPFRRFVLGENTENITGLSTPAKISEPFISCNEPPSPYTDEYLSALEGRIAYLETSRGCPFSCSFCLSGRCGTVRYFDMDRVKKDILRLNKSGAKTIKLVDRTFNSSNSRAVEILEFIKDNYDGSNCFHLEIAGDIIGEKLMETMCKMPSGAIQVEIGLQSFNENTLEAVNRKTNVKKLEANIKKLIEAGNIHVHVDLIAGLPLEGLEEFERSFNRAFSMKPHMLQLGFLKLLHGSPMEETRSGSFSCEPPYEVLETPFINRGQIKELKKTEDAVERLWNSGRFREVTQYLAGKYGKGAFKLFCELGKIEGTGLSLDTYTEKLIQVCKSFADEDVLIDKLVAERMETNASGRLPLCLQKEPMGGLLKALDKEARTRRLPGVKRCAARLSTGSIIYADYSEENKMNGKYQLKEWTLNEQ